MTDNDLSKDAPEILFFDLRAHEFYLNSLTQFNLTITDDDEPRTPAQSNAFKAIDTIGGPSKSTTKKSIEEEIVESLYVLKKHDEAQSSFWVQNILSNDLTKIESIKVPPRHRKRVL